MTDLPADMVKAAKAAYREVASPGGAFHEGMEAAIRTIAPMIRQALTEWRDQ